MKRRISLLLVLLFLLSTVVNVNAATFKGYVNSSLYEPTIEGKVQTFRSIGGVLVPSIETKLGPVTQNFVDNFHTNSTKRIDILKDIGNYFLDSDYAYSAKYGTSEIIQALDRHESACYGFNLMALNILDGLNIPYKVVNVILRNGRELSIAHTTLLVQMEDGTFKRFEPAYAGATGSEEEREFRRIWARESFLKGNCNEDLKKYVSTDKSRKVTSYELYVSPTRQSGVLIGEDDGFEFFESTPDDPKLFGK